MIDKCHADGLKVGMHMMNNFVGKDDAFAASRVRYLFTDSGQVLARDIGTVDREIPAQGSMVQFMRSMYEVSRDVRIDDEIVHYEAIGGPGSTMLLQCTRGYAGTRPVSHKSGAKIQHLAEYSGSYLADLTTPLKDDISERIAGLIDRCGFDMIFFDGENCINGPCWYWGGLQKTDIVKRVKRDLLVEGSGMSHWAWHSSTRGYCDDFAAVAPKQYLDYHKIDHWWNFYSRSFMPVELGWWGFLSSATDHPATMPEEVEHYAVRMLSLNAPISLETSLDALKANGRTDEMLRLLGEYEQLRLGDAVSLRVREKLRSGEWRMVRKDGHPQFLPVKYDTMRPDANGEVRIRNEFGPQNLKFRLQAGPNLAKVGDRSNITLLRPDTPLVLTQPGPGGLSPGMLAARILFTGATAGQAGMLAFGRGSSMVQGGTPPNLSSHRALAMKVNVEGTPPLGGEKSAVLNVQLESGGFYRDYYINLDFAGECTIIVPESNTERMLPDLRPASSAYLFKTAMLGFNYRDISAINFRWMRLPAGKQVKYTITAVEALAETESDLKTPEIIIGAAKIIAPVTLKTGDYLEFWGSGPVRVFNRNGVELSTFQIADSVMLATGYNRIFLRGDGTVSAKLTIMLQGLSLSL